MKIIIAAISIVFVITGCSFEGRLRGEKIDNIEGLVRQPAHVASLYERPMVVSASDGIAVYAWYDPKRMLMLSAAGNVHHVSEGYLQPSLFSFNLLYADTAAIYSVIRSKGALGEGWKQIIFRASYDNGKTFSDFKILNEDAGAMEPTIAANGKGTVYVAWYDERGGKYDIFMNVSHDYGRTWQGEQRVSTADTKGAINPQILTSGDRAWIIWREGGGRVGHGLFMRSTSDSGRTWSEAFMINKEANIYDHKIVKIGERIVVLWCGASRIQYFLRGIYSDDSGKTWHKIGESKIMSYMQFEITVATDSGGNIYLALPVRDKYRVGIDNIYFLRSSDKAATWSEPIRLQTNTPHHTFAIIPSIAVDNRGGIAVVWTDYRNIRGNIYMNVSRDYGSTWLSREIPISSPDKNAELPAIAISGDRVNITWLQYNDDKMKDAVVVMRDVPMQIKPFSQNVQTDNRKDLLIQRVKEYYDLKLKGRHEEGYDYQDIFFRTRVTKRNYLGNMVDVKYHSYSIGEIKITENIAKVSLEAEIEIPETPFMGKIISLAKKKDSWEDDWAWIDGDWQKVFKYNTNNSYIPLFPSFPL